MLEFRDIDIDDEQIFMEKANKIKAFICDFCFVDIFIWACHFKTQIAFDNDFVFLKVSGEDENVVRYISPIGIGDYKSAIEKIIKHGTDNNYKFTIASIPSEAKDFYSEDQFIVTENRNSSDYVYDAQSLITLKGKKLHSKRNFINRFTENNEGKWLYESMTLDNIPKAREFHKKWCKENGCTEDDMAVAEICAIERCFNNFEKLGIVGGILTLEGEIIAMSMGKKVRDDLFIIQIEKADPTIAGAYPMINNLFAKENCMDVKYINREEDLGLEGLRKAKLSYRPEFLAEKFTATVR